MPNPDLIPEPFAQSGDKNPIPLERAIADPIYRASWKAGFPPDTRLPKDVGGEAPDGLDFNGVLNILSQAVVFLQKGNAYQFDASLAPYPIGALVRSNDNLTTYQSTVVSNSNNPNSNMTGWRIYNGSGFIVDNLTTNDSAKALSAAQGKVLQDNKLEENKVGAANGVASLGANTKVPVAQLPAATISDAGVLRFATATEVGNRTNVSAAVNPANVSQMFGRTQDQITLPDGTVMKFGVATVGADSNLSLNFPSPFQNACLNAQATLNSSSFDVNADAGCGVTWSKTGLVLRNGCAVSVNISWFAIGY